MKINDIPEFKDKSEILTFPHDTNINDVIAGMSEKNYGAAVITDDNKIAGIFTERDVLRKVAGKGFNFKKKKVSEFMTTNVQTATAEDRVYDCLKRMSDGRFRHLPVVDEEGNLKGMLSQGDFVAFTMGDIIARLGTTTKAEISAGRSTPVAIAASIVLYAVGLIALVNIFT